MPDPVPSFELPPGGVMGDTRFYARAVDAIRHACTLVGEAADAAQRAGFFARLANWADEADAAAFEAEQAAVWASVSARRASRETEVYREAARRTVAEIASAYFPAEEGDSAGSVTSDGASSSSAEAMQDKSPGVPPSASRAAANSALDAVMLALDSLAKERRDEAAMVDRRPADDGYVEMAGTLNILTEAHDSYRDVADALDTLLKEQEAYRQEFDYDSQTALAADIQADLVDVAQKDRVSGVREALADLRVVRSAYNDSMTNHVWDLMADVRISLSKAGASIREVQASVGANQEARDPYGASAMLAALRNPGETSPETYDTAIDAVAEVADDLFRCRDAYVAVQRVLAEVRAVAADALIEARAAVGADALLEARAAYDLASSALDALLEAQSEFAMGLATAIPDFIKSGR